MFMFGSLALLVTGWVVSDHAPGTPTGWVAPTFVVLGLLYGVVMQTVLHLQEGDAKPGAFLLGGVLILGPFGCVVWGATAWMDGSAYAYLSAWCWWTLAACAALYAGGAMWRLLRRLSA